MWAAFGVQLNLGMVCIAVARRRFDANGSHIDAAGSGADDHGQGVQGHGIVSWYVGGSAARGGVLGRYLRVSVAGAGHEQGCSLHHQLALLEVSVFAWVSRERVLAIWCLWRVAVSCGELCRAML